MLWENLVKFKDPLLEKFSETYKYKIAHTTSGDSETLEAHIQIPRGGMVLTLAVFELLPCAKHHGDPTPNSTHYHTECWTILPCPAWNTCHQVFCPGNTYSAAHHLLNKHILNTLL